MNIGGEVVDQQHRLRVNFYFLHSLGEYENHISNHIEININIIMNTTTSIQNNNASSRANEIRNAFEKHFIDEKN